MYGTIINEIKLIAYFNFNLRSKYGNKYCAEDQR